MSKHAAPTVASRTVVRTRTTGQSVVRLVKQILLGSAVLGIAFLGLGAYASSHLPAPASSVPAPAPAPASTATYPDDPASLNAASRNHDRKSIGPMVASSIDIDLGRSAKLRGSNDEGVFEHSSLCQILHQG